jgi:pantoate--beta-alanine ligase
MIPWRVGNSPTIWVVKSALASQAQRATDFSFSGARSRENILSAVRQIIQATPGARIDYAALVDPTTLQEVEAIQGEARLLLAVWINNTRLIDNTLLSESLLCCV